jgi:hypothetical protein
VDRANGTLTTFAKRSALFVWRRSERKDLQLVKNKLVRNPHEAEVKGVSSEAFEDEHMQYAFRRQAGNLLLETKRRWT